MQNAKIIEIYVEMASRILRWRIELDTAVQT
jgi:hypothetical protein